MLRWADRATRIALVKQVAGAMTSADVWQQRHMLDRDALLRRLSCLAV